MRGGLDLFGRPANRPAGAHLQLYAQASTPLASPRRLFVLRGSVVHHAYIRDDDTSSEFGQGTTLYLQPALILRGRSTDGVRPELQIGASLPVAGLLAGDSGGPFGERVCRPGEETRVSACRTFHSGGLYASVGFNIGARD